MPTFKLDRALTAAAEGKALGLHPAFTGRDPVSTYSQGSPRKDAVLSQRSAARHAEAYGDKQAIDHVFDCINLYADSVATAEWGLKKPDGTQLVRTKTKGTPPDNEVGPEDLYKLLDRPNPYQLYDEVMALLVIDLMLVGNAYWLKWRPDSAGKPLALYRLAPSHVKIVPDEFGPKRYEYQPPGAKNKLEIKPENMIHFRRPNPHSAYYGMGVIQGAGRSMDLELAITDTMASYYENKADPSLIIQSDRRVPRDVFQKLRAQLRAKAAGTKNAGELLLLESGLKASSLSVSARDALFKELSMMSRDRIYAKFHASPLLFGIIDQSSSPNKVSDMRSEFDNYTLRPFMHRLAKQISAALVETWGLEYVIDHRSILPPEEAVKVAESIAKMPGVKVREVRKQYRQFGIEESTGDPELDEMVLNKPMGDLDENGMPIDPKIPSGADPNLGSEPGRPPKVKNTTAIGTAGKKALDPYTPTTFEFIEARLSAIGAGKSLGGPVSTPAPDNSLPGELRPTDTFARARKVDIDDSTSFIAAGLRDAAVELERDLLDHVEGKALKTSDLLGRIRNSDAWGKFKARVEEVLVEGATRAAQSSVMHSGLTPDEEMDYESIAKSAVHRKDGLKSIIATIKKRVLTRVKEARDGDAERAELEAVVRAVTNDWAASQASLIADTEATIAYNEATLTVAEAAGIGSVFVVDGDDDDAPCIEANGSVWSIDEAREKRLEHPRCRRAFLPFAQVA